MTPFTPDSFIGITSNGGNIGRFFWANKASYTLELWGTDGFYESNTYDIPGDCAFITTENDWHCWLMR